MAKLGQSYGRLVIKYGVILLLTSLTGLLVPYGRLVLTYKQWLSRLQVTRRDG